MKPDPLFTNLFEQTDFSDQYYPDLLSHFSSVSSDFQLLSSAFQSPSDKIDDELFQTPIFAPKNAEFGPEQNYKVEDRFRPPRKNSTTSQEEPFILTDFKVR